MKIGILETGLLNEKVVDRFEPYPVMFKALLDLAGQDLEYRSYSVIRGEMPDSTDECDGWLITGSRHGVYEKLDWMLSLENFIRRLYEASAPLVGVCFGHQIIAQALGGVVEKSDKGWGVGLHYYEIVKPQPWMATPPETIRIYAFHQDQVIIPPPDAEVFCQSDFCPYAGLVYGKSIVSVQAHPEFEKSYEQTLLEIYGGNIVPETVADHAFDGMKAESSQADTQILADWLATFLCTA